MTIAVDPAKAVFEIAVSEGGGAIIGRHRLSRAQFQRFCHSQAPANGVMEACGTAPFRAQGLTHQRFTVRLLPVQYVRPLSAS